AAATRALERPGAGQRGAPGPKAAGAPRGDASGGARGPGARLPQVPGPAGRHEGGSGRSARGGPGRSRAGAARGGVRGGAVADAARTGTDTLPEDGGRLGRTAGPPRELRPRPVPGEPGHPRPVGGPLLADLSPRSSAAPPGGGVRRGVRPGMDAAARGARAVSPEAPGLLARPWVRIACAILGTAVLAASVWAAGAPAVLASLGASVHALPLLALLEAVMVACSTLALRALYGEAASLVPARQWVRAGALGYALGL